MGVTTVRLHPDIDVIVPRTPLLKYLEIITDHKANKIKQSNKYNINDKVNLQAVL